MSRKTMNRLWLAAAGVMVAASCAAPAWAEPAPIDDGSGPRTVGAEIEDGSGVPGPSFDEPVSIPAVTADKATDPKEYERQVNARAQAQALEAARIAAKAYRECVARANENEVC